jgi:sulfur-oxidizing protein SoxX
MRIDPSKPGKTLPSRKSLLALRLPLLLAVGGLALADTQAAAAEPAVITEGRAIAFARDKGNCLACHMIKDGEAYGNIAPPLLMMEQRYPDKDKLRAQIANASAANPETSMPLFGKHEILTREELDKVVEFVWSL